MPQLHQRGVDLLLNLMDAEEHFENVTRDELRQLISESIVVFGHLIERDIPENPLANSVGVKSPLPSRTGGFPARPPVR